MDGIIHRHTKPGTAPGTLAGRAPVAHEHELAFPLPQLDVLVAGVLPHHEVERAVGPPARLRRHAVQGAPCNGRLLTCRAPARLR